MGSPRKARSYGEENFTDAKRPAFLSSRCLYALPDILDMMPEAGTGYDTLLDYPKIPLKRTIVTGYVWRTL